MEQPDVPDTREEDVDMITIPSESLPAAGAGEDGVSVKSTTGPAGTDGALDSPPTEEGQGLPIRTDAPPIAEQIQTIQTLLKAYAEKQLDQEEVVYLVSRQWLDKAIALGSAKTPSKEADESELGPVDNSDIVQTVITDANGAQFVKLKPGMGLEDFELFPQDAWDMLVEWHGLAAGQIPVTRTAHNTNMDAQSLPNIQFEFHPPVFTIHRIWSANSPLPIEQDLKLQNPPPPVVVHSSSYKLHDFLKEAKGLVKVPLDRKVRLWRILQTLPAEEASPQPAGLYTPPDSPRQDAAPRSFPHLLVEVTDFLKLQKDVERDLIEVTDTTHHAKYNGSRTLATANLTVDQALVLDENIPPDWVSTFNPRTATFKEKGPAVRGTSAGVSSKAGSGRNSPALAPITRGRAGQQQKSGRTIGCVGLQNLGNTCYMNSALQCVRSVEELTKYFLMHESEKEINTENPLAHNGDVARAYGRLLEEMYRDPAPGSVAPRNFKNVIGRHAPAFSGYGQQDSQEFLGFLLDGLQEDLNRIKKKPYIEKPDSTDDMIGNQAAIREMADKVWDITKKRDDSVIADLFTGMYQSTLVCPVCSKVSITFDPFTNLTLPLPVANVWNTSKLRFFPLNDEPVEMDVDLDKTSSIKALKKFVSERVGVPVERLFAAEGFRNKFFKLYEDLSTVSEEIGSNDIPVVYELEAAPTNVPYVKYAKKQKYRSLLDDTEETSVPIWEEPASERIVVPVIHRVATASKWRSKGDDNHIPAHCIVLTVQEARSEETIRRKILEKMASFSTWKGFDDSEVEESTDPEMVNASSDGDSNVVAHSVEDEDGLVDVKMTDDSTSTQAADLSKDYPKLLRKFNTQRPKWVDSKQFLDPELQNLFALSYFRGGPGSIPCSWDLIQDEKHFPSLSSRQPRPPSDTEMNSPSNDWEGSEESGNDESISSQPTVATRMVDESSEDESDLPATKNATLKQNVRAASQGVQRGKKKTRPYKTYGKKGQRKQGKQAQKEASNSLYRSSADPNDQEEGSAFDGGPLVRLGEGIVVDWPENAYDAVFGADYPSDERGMARFKTLAKLHDQSLESYRKQRDTQRKQGISLDDCLAEFEKEEILSEQDTWYCPRCKEHRRASKKFDLWKTPDILAIHLKRFSSAGYRREKLDILVDFPVEGLDLTKRVVDKGDGKQEIYDLIAVDDHWGGLGGGHYTAFAKNFIDGEWYEYNDTSVSKQKDPSRVVTKSAYLLFYRRRSDTALGGPRFQEISERYNNQPADTDMSDSGEGQRLGHGSSQRGSSSALTGAGPTLHNGNRGLDSDQSGGRVFGNGAGMSDYSPLYPNYIGMDDVAEDADNDNDQMTGVARWQVDQPRRSIEQDEGVDMVEWAGQFDSDQTAGGLAANLEANWNFRNIESGGPARSEAGDSDIDSLAAQGDEGSSIIDDMEDEESKYAHIDLGGPHPRHVGSNSKDQELEPVIADHGLLDTNPGASYTLPDESHPPPYDDENGLPKRDQFVKVITADEIGFTGDADNSKHERVTEIHIEEDKEEDNKNDEEAEQGPSSIGQPKAS